jgi:hypothetical protein
MGHVLCVQGAARQARRETQVHHEVDHRAHRGHGEGAGQAGSHHRVFGLSHTIEGFNHMHCELFYRIIFDTVYESAKRGDAAFTNTKAGAGASIKDQERVVRLECGR